MRVQVCTSLCATEGVSSAAGAWVSPPPGCYCQFEPFFWRADLGSIRSQQDNVSKKSPAEERTLGWSRTPTLPLRGRHPPAGLPRTPIGWFIRGPKSEDLCVDCRQPKVKCFFRPGVWGEIAIVLLCRVGHVSQNADTPHRQLPVCLSPRSSMDQHHFTARPADMEVTKPRLPTDDQAIHRI